MVPSKTKYVLVSTPQQYKECRTLYEKNHGEPLAHPLMFPTVMALREGRCVGFLSTHPRKDCVMAGPLEVEGGHNPFTAMRLIEAYEVVLRRAGVSQYLFATRGERTDSLAPKKVQTLESWGVTFLGYDKGCGVFRKDLK